VNPLSHLRTHLRHRSPWEVVGGYVVVAWIVLQVAETLASLGGLPLWFGKAVLLLLGAGLPMVLVTALLHRPGTSDRAGRILPGWTWRRTAHTGIAAFALLGLATAGHLTARALGIGPLGTLPARGMLPEGAELLLAPFHDHVHDPELARALTRALRVHLSQSPSFSLASEARIEVALERMGVDPGEPLDRTRARDVATREGIEAVLHGEIHRVGSGFTLSATLLSHEGAELVTALEEADGEEELIDAVERLSVRLRERMGESLASVRRSPPLSRVRTSSLPALRSYTEAAAANSRGEFERCVLESDEAIAVDSLFAMAYAARAACNRNLGRDRAGRVADWTRAYRLRDRMTSRERLRLTAVYHQHVAGDRSRAVEAWKAYLDRYPESPAAHFALANLQAEGRRWSEAETTLLRGLELDSSSVIVLLNLAMYRVNLGRYRDAVAALDGLADAAPGLALSPWRASLALSAGAWEEAEEWLEEALRDGRERPAARARALELEGRLAWTRGRVSDGERAFRQALAADSVRGAGAEYHRRAAGLAWIRLHALGDTAGALGELEAARSAFPFDGLPPLDRPYFGHAQIHARAGEPEAARRLLEAWRRDAAPLLADPPSPSWLLGLVAEAEGALERALDHWRTEDQTREDPVSVAVELGRLHHRLGRSDSAAVHDRRYLDTPSSLRHYVDPAHRGTALERLAHLHEAAGNREAAVRRYRELVELWADADPALQPRVEAARERAAALGS
jgi:tetratricopeptide (TPR) repeat protein